MPIRPQKWHAVFRPNISAENEGALEVSDNLSSESNITGLSNGGFVSTWIEVNAASMGLNIKAQIYDALGNRVGGEIAVNTSGFVGPSSSINGPNGFLDVAAQPGGGFVVVWERNIGNGDIAFQRFSNTGAKLGGETNVAGAADNNDAEFDPSVATLTDGSFVVSWSEETLAGSTGKAGVHATVFTAAGAVDPGGRDLFLNSTGSAIFGLARSGELAATSDGGFVLVNSISSFTAPNTSDSGDIYYNLASSAQAAAHRRGLNCQPFASTHSQRVHSRARQQSRGCQMAVGRSPIPMW
jgi:hypothetical protein